MIRLLMEQIIQGDLSMVVCLIELDEFVGVDWRPDHFPRVRPSGCHLVSRISRHGILNDAGQLYLKKGTTYNIEPT